MSNFGRPQGPCQILPHNLTQSNSERDPGPLLDVRFLDEVRPPCVKFSKKKVVTRVKVCDRSVNFSCAPRPMSKFAAALGPLCQSVCTTVKVSAPRAPVSKFPPKRSSLLSIFLDVQCMSKSQPAVGTPCVKFSKKTSLPVRRRPSLGPLCQILTPCVNVSNYGRPRGPYYPALQLHGTAHPWLVYTCLLGIPSIDGPVAV